MTTEEIKKMIIDTLQGQGNQVDIGGGIPKILNAIVEKIDEGGSENILEFKPSVNMTDGTSTFQSFEEFIAASKPMMNGVPMTVEDFAALAAAEDIDVFKFGIEFSGGGQGDGSIITARRLFFEDTTEQGQKSLVWNFMMYDQSKEDKLLVRFIIEGGVGISVNAL